MTDYARTPSKRERWKARVTKTPALTHGTRLFLATILAQYMKADGFVSQPRKLLASAAGISERQVTRYMSAAVDSGWLMVVQPGYRTVTAEYQASFPNPASQSLNVTELRPESGTQNVPHSSTGKRDVNGPPFRVTNTSRFTPKKRDVMRPTTSSTTTTRFGAGLERNGSHLLRPRRFGLGISAQNLTNSEPFRAQPKPVESQHAARLRAGAGTHRNPAAPCTTLPSFKVRTTA